MSTSTLLHESVIIGGVTVPAGQELGDVLLGRQRDLMEALFPPLTSDLLTFYLAF